MASPQLQEIVATLRGRPSGETLPLEEYRAGLEQLTASLPRPADLEHWPLDAGGVPAEWLRVAGSEPARVLFYLHGGAYVRGSPASHRGLAGRLCAAAGARALVVDYRLAPEHPFPAALEDALTAWHWLLDQGVAPGRSAVAGDSAGGGLALALLAALRDAGAPLPGAAVLLSPWTDLTGSGESIRSRAAQDPFVNEAYLHAMARHYLRDADPRDPRASPLFAPLHGLPPLLIQVGSAEVLRDDATRVAERAAAAGTEVACEEWPEMIHVWHLFAPTLPEGEQAIARVGAWLRPRLD